MQCLFSRRTRAAIRNLRRSLRVGNGLDPRGGGVGGRFALDVRLEANVPAIGALFGQDWGRWEVTFGALIEGVPAAIVDPLFDTGGADADVWLLQARAHALG